MNKTAQSVWNNCLLFIKDNISEQAFKTWFEPIEAVKLENNALSIQVPSKFFYEWLEEHFVKLLKVSLTRELGKNARLVYVIKMENPQGVRRPFTERIPSTKREKVYSLEIDVHVKTRYPELINSFVIMCIQHIMIDPHLYQNYIY